MRYLVSTHSFLLAVDLNADWTLRNLRVLRRGHHYGIGFPEASNARRILVKNDDEELLILDAERLSLLGTRLPFPGPTGAVHQIACGNDGVYLANTDRNSLVYHNWTANQWVEYHFNGQQHDHNHINSVFPCGHQVYALLHNRGRTMSELAVLDHSDRSRLTLDHTLSLWDHGCHNIYIDGHRIFYNASTKGDFVVADAAQETVVKRLTYPGHTKGLSVTRDHLVIGCSDHTPRPERYTSQGHLAVMDRHHLRPITTIDLNQAHLPHPVGNVNEVRCISERDYAHAGPERPAIDWSQRRLAKRNPFDFARRQLVLSSGQLKRKLLRWAS